MQTKRFDEFWSLYPKKTAKKEARKSWGRVKPDTALFEKILNAVKCAAKSEQWQREHGRFIPNPATWLNQGRWDDEILHRADNSSSNAGKVPPAQKNTVINSIKTLRRVKGLPVNLPDNELLEWHEEYKTSEES